MVRLNRIYTKTGDDGTTGLGTGERVPKHSARIAAYGTVDELSSFIGMALSLDDEARQGGRFDEVLFQIQNDLFDLGADLCIPPTEGEEGMLRITPAYVERLEGWIDEHNADLEPLKTFILPGGRPLAAWLHIARTVSRRAERLACELRAAEPDKVGEDAVHYLNRLSDLLFVMARVTARAGSGEVYWQPGRAR